MSAAKVPSAVAASPKPVAHPPPPKALAYVDDMIRSGKYTVLFTALKGFRNGMVYGTRVRAPHALVLNLVWSKAPYSTIPGKVYRVTKEHALGLGYSAVTFVLVRTALKYLQGSAQLWHSIVAGYVIGFVFWGNPGSPVHLQMMMYVMSRMVCAMYHLIVEKYALTVPTVAYRFYSGALWALVMYFLLGHPNMIQSSMRQSLQYIFLDSGSYSSWYDVFCVNTADSL